MWTYNLEHFLLSMCHVAVQLLRGYKYGSEVKKQRQFYSCKRAACLWIWCPRIHKNTRYISQRRAAPACLSRTRSVLGVDFRGHKHVHNAEYAIEVIILSVMAAPAAPRHCANNEPLSTRNLMNEITKCALHCMRGVAWVHFCAFSVLKRGPEDKS